jgi:cytidylate kinase
MRVTISGPIGSGKSTVGKIISRKLSISFFSGGNIFREEASRMNMSVEEYNIYSETHPDVDLNLDRMQLKYLMDHDDLVFESRLAGWLCWKNGISAFKLFLDASEDVRYQRVKNRESNRNNENLLSLIRSREESERKRYMSLYKMNYSDHGFYDLYIGTDNMVPDEVAEIAIRHLRKIQ